MNGYLSIIDGAVEIFKKK